MKVPWTFPYLQHDKNTGPWNQKPGFWNRVCYQLYYLLSLGSSFLTDLRAYTFDTSASPFRPHLHPHLGGHTSLHCLKSCSVLGWNPKSSGSGPRLRLLLPLTPLPLARSLHSATLASFVPSIRASSLLAFALALLSGMFCPQVFSDWLLLRVQISVQMSLPNTAT